MGDIVRYTGANVTLPNGDKLGGVLMYGEVMGPVASGDRDKRVKVYLAGTDSDDDRDEHGLPLTGRMKVFFPGNKENISCLLSEVRLWRAATGPSGERLPPPPAPRWTDPRDEVSYEVGEKVIYTGASQNLPSGNKLVHGQQGEVTGPATAEMATGKGVSVLFPGNKGSINCRLTTVRRLRAASAATPPPAPRTRDAAHAPCVPATASAAAPHSPHCMRSRSRRGRLPGCGRVGGRGLGAGWLLRWQRQRGRRPSPTCLLLTAGGCVRR